jgi:hypothetical protein
VFEQPPYPTKGEWENMQLGERFIKGKTGFRKQKTRAEEKILISIKAFLPFGV